MTIREIPAFDYMLSSEAWAACDDWSDWAYSNAPHLSDDAWDSVVEIMRTNYVRYYERYENE